MKKTLLLACAALAVAAFADQASAQSTGSVRVIGAVSPVGAIRWWDWTPTNTETGTNTAPTQNAPLDFTIDLSELAAGLNFDTYAGGNVTAILRSNESYRLFGEVTSSTGFGSSAAGDLELADVGFGILNLTNSGAATKVFGDPAGDASLTAGFGNDPNLAPKDVDEEPLWNPNYATLQDIASVTQVMAGPRISNRGGNNSPNNGLLVDFGFAVGPQYYTPVANFEAVVEFTMATP
ncbi:MAG: hypothetical protein KDA27_14395 [Candidatus Eisenbacteria bacterium]|uniref:PEP-CTERM sorting domain-containing protein n=1 Tax=Eiseniibacteriota bacterium TaxID=2212470 RepID=A0A956NEF8_UNCEI|nr:hypothetical protein [Candidatus Eisenbacteria bacterium]MCB9464028.1 hypothetical protein [Candidatus Eisenbacteria bacterium]